MTSGGVKFIRKNGRVIPLFFSNIPRSVYLGAGALAAGAVIGYKAMQGAKGRVEAEFRTGQAHVKFKARKNGNGVSGG